MEGRPGISGSLGGDAAWGEKVLWVETPRKVSWGVGGSEGVGVRSTGPGCQTQLVCDPLQARGQHARGQYAWGQHAMQFPAELTRDACKTQPGELRLICIYFSNAHFFKVSVMAGQGGWVPAPSWDPLQVPMSLPGL